MYEISIEVRVDYDAQVMSLYGDYLPILREQRTDILRGRSNDAGVQRYRAALGRTERALAQMTTASE